MRGGEGSVGKNAAEGGVILDGGHSDHTKRKGERERIQDELFATGEGKKY